MDIRKTFAAELAQLESLQAAANAIINDRRETISMICKSLCVLYANAQEFVNCEFAIHTPANIDLRTQNGRITIRINDDRKPLLEFQICDQFYSLSEVKAIYGKQTDFESMRINLLLLIPLLEAKIEDAIRARLVAQIHEKERQIADLS
jgi:hypothetical protein